MKEDPNTGWTEYGGEETDEMYEDVQRLSNEITKILKPKNPIVQSLVMEGLLANWILGFEPEEDLEATRRMNAQRLDVRIENIKYLIAQFEEDAYNEGKAKYN